MVAWAGSGGSTNVWHDVVPFMGGKIRVYPAAVFPPPVQVLTGAQMYPEALSAQKLDETISQLLGTYQEGHPSPAQVRRAHINVVLQMRFESGNCAKGFDP